MLKANYKLCTLILSAVLLSCSNIDSSTEGAAFVFFSTDAAESKKEISSTIKESSDSIIICASFIDDPEIVDAIIQKQSELTTEVEVIVDSRSLNLPGTKKLINNRISVHGRAADAMMNSFFIVSDERKIITGSYDMKVTSGKQICSVAVFNDKTMADNYRREFYILKTGQSPLSKDSEFDLKLGPMSTEYEPGWYSINQVFLDDGSIKGLWGEDEILISSSVVKNYFTPYRLSNRGYADYSLNVSGTYSRSAINYNYTDFETGSATPEERIDFINIIAPMIRNAESSLIIFASVLTEKVIIDEIIRAKSRGLKIEIYLDYDMTLNMRDQIPSSLNSLLINADTMRLYKPDSGASLSMNLIQIDHITYVICSAGFTRRSFTGNDASITIIENNQVMNNEIKKAITSIMAYSRIYDPEKDYTGMYEICEYKEKL